MLERIRRLCMERIKDMRLAIVSKPGPLCHRIHRILEKRICYADRMSYSWNGLDGFEIFSHNGIPCIYARPAICSKKQLPIDWVDNFYKISTFGWLYENVLESMTGPSEWPKTRNITLLPLKFVRQAGRPKLSRKRDITEVRRVKGKEKVTRWHSQTCKYCGIVGHNVQTCVKKKADTEGRGVQPKKCTRAKATEHDAPQEAIEHEEPTEVSIEPAEHVEAPQEEPAEHDESPHEEPAEVPAPKKRPRQQRKKQLS
ncbi:hypothetical protein LIER_29839 [Lithospermum erythrorhizon]|uniref:Uncharacterized protein n=1 Tax=Lithospermum erythrorhizon TaxID=34254 RepID=A0AAV3RLP0_LITER